MLSADFDFVVCTKDQGEPLIVVEFDGYTRGYSQNGQHVSKLADDDRRHKFNTKLTACSFYQMPMVIVSNEEAFWGDDDMLTVLDAIVGSVIAAKHTGEDVRLQMNELSRALEEDPTGDAAGAVLDAITLKNELKYNPVVRRTAEMRKQIGYSGGKRRSNSCEIRGTWVMSAVGSPSVVVSKCRPPNANTTSTSPSRCICEPSIVLGALR